MVAYLLPLCPSDSETVILPALYGGRERLRGSDLLHFVRLVGWAMSGDIDRALESTAELQRLAGAADLDALL